MSYSSSSGYTLYGPSIPPFPTFKAVLPWIGGDLQTVKNTLVWRRPLFERERQSRVALPLGDSTGDSLFALLDHPKDDTGLPLLILIHGLTGSEDSRNIMVSAMYFLNLGFPVLRLNLRGAGPSQGLSQEHYHAGRSEDIKAALATITPSLSENGIVAVGISLGGNTLLKFASENPERTDVRAYASVCAPIDLQTAQKRIMAPRNALYHRHLLRHMKAGAFAHAADKAAITETLKKVTSVYAYDDLIVAPQNGFAGAEDYYAQSSARPRLNKIKTPTLLIHAKTDPWIPSHIYEDRTWLSDGPLSLLVSDDGGHVGFHGHHIDTPWHNLCIGQFFLNVLGR